MKVVPILQVRCGNRGWAIHTLFVGIVMVLCTVSVGAASPAATSAMARAAKGVAPSSITATPRTKRTSLPLTIQWQWQLASTPARYIPGVTLYDVDSGTSAAVVADMHAHGITVACYFSAGTVDAKYPDASLFPPSILGNVFAGFPSERWLDYTQSGIVYPLMAARFQLCASKGFDAIEADNVDGYTANTGFGLTYQTQLAYNTWLANEAHAYGLSIALKNDPDQVRDLVGLFDWSLVESCFDYHECDLYQPFIVAGKPVMEVEYNLTTSQFCAQANAMNFNAMVKHTNLDAYRVSCRAARPSPDPMPVPRPGGSPQGGTISPPLPRPGSPSGGAPDPMPVRR